MQRKRQWYPYAQECYAYTWRHTRTDPHTLDVATRPMGVVSLTNSFIPRKTLCHPLQGILNGFCSLFKINAKRKYPTSARTHTPVIPTNSLSPNWLNYHRSIIFVYKIIQPKVMRKKHGMFQDSNENLVPKNPMYQYTSTAFHSDFRVLGNLHLQRIS